jgi:hypothetical protein
MIEYLNLFKALPVKERTSSFSTDYLKQGVLVEDSVVSSYSKAAISSLIAKLIPTDSQINKTFHKSWKKVRDASIQQLVIEQLIHYFTTYGLENLGFYNNDTVYLPNEQLDLEASGGIAFLVLKGITLDEISSRVQNILSSGMALSDSDLDDLVAVIQSQELHISISECNNREMKVRLYDLLRIVPGDPVEYLRLQVYRATESTMLIKSQEAIMTISNNVKRNVFVEYEKMFGLTRLAPIFHRFKPLFLAFKNKKSANTINRIRRLAVKHHQPMPEDYLASVTKHIRNGTFNVKKFYTSLENANVFRKIKLVQALRFYENKDVSGVVYSVRNGRSFTSATTPIGNASEAIFVTMKSLAEDLKHLKDKKVYVHPGLVAPTSGKMFYGDLPIGSFFSTKDSLVLGVSWKDAKNYRVDLDLSMISIGGKIGWDSGYRNKDFLFSGDITAAPDGATEAHLVRAGIRDGIYLLNLNYYNAYNDSPEVPFTAFVAKENEFERMNKNAMVSQDNMLFWANSTIDPKRSQKSIGVLKIHNGVKTFHIFESKMGRGMTAHNDERSRNMISFYDIYLKSLLDMKTLLWWADAKLVDNPKEADIDLSLSSLTKDTLIKLLTGTS